MEPKSLNSRLLLLTVLAAAPLLCLVLYNAAEQRRDAVRGAVAQAVRMSAEASRAEERIVLETRDFLASLADSPPVRRGDAALARLFSGLLAREPRYANILLADRGGRIIASGVPVRRDPRLADRPVFREVLKSREFAAAGYTVGAITGKPVIVFGYPVGGSGSKIRGVLIATLDVAWLNRQFPPTEAVLPGSTVTRIDRNGLVFAHSPGDGSWIGQPLPVPGLARAVAARRRGFEEAVGPDRRRWGYAFSDTRGFNGLGETYVILGVPRNALFEGANRRLAVNLALLAAAMLIAFGGAYLVARAYVLRPVASILGAVERISRGDFSARSGVSDRPGELGELARGVDGMAESLARRDEAQRRAEAALRRSEEHFRTLIENATDIVTALDETGIVQYQSPSLERILGYRPGEVVGKSVFEFVHPEDVPAFAAELRKVLEAPGLTSTATFRVRHRDGGWRHLEGTRRAVVRPGEKPVVMVSSRDVTERIEADQALRRAEEHLLQAQKMEAVGRLAGGVAHDFNNVLTAIMGYSDLLLARLGSDSPGRAEAEEIRKACKHAAELTRQLLTFSRKQKARPGVLDLNAELTGMETMLRRLIGEDISVRTDLARGLWPVAADPGQIAQLVVNLAVNARDAMPRGGTLTLRTANVTLSEARVVRDVTLPPGPYVTLAVADTGCGMDAETMSHLFEPFFTTKEKGKGTGLGLSTVYGIVRQAGGAVEVASEPGSGSTFTVHLPRAEGTTVAPGGDPAEAVRGRGETILVVEDEPSVRDLVCKVLQSVGYAVLAAGSGKEALALLAEHKGRVDLLLTDVVMREMDGGELAERVAACKPGVRTLYMSGYTNDVLRAKGFPEKGAAFLRKPFKPVDLARRVREVLDARPVA